MAKWRWWTTREREIVRQAADEGLTQERAVLVLRDAGYTDRNRNAVAKFAQRQGIAFHGHPYRYGNNNRWNGYVKKGKDKVKRAIRDRRYHERIKNGHKPIPRSVWLWKMRQRRYARIARRTRRLYAAD